MHTINPIKNYLIFCVVVLLLGAQFLSVSSDSAVDDDWQDAKGIEPQISQAATGLTFQWSLDQSQVQLLTFSQDAYGEDGGLFTRITLPGFVEENVPGELKLPGQSHLIVLPSGSTPETRITFLAAETLFFDYPFAFSPIPVGIKTPLDEGIIERDYVFPDSSNQFEDRPIIQFEEIGRMAGARLGRVTFNPIIYNSEMGEYQLVTELEMFLDYGGSAELNPSKRALSHLTRLQDTLVAQVVNPELIGIDTPSANSQLRLAQTVSPPQPSLILELVQTGIFEITYADLLASGAGVISINPSLWQLAKEGSLVDMHWVGDGDNVFEANERFLFYSPPSANRWSTSEFYALTAGLTAGSRVGTSTPPGGSLPPGKLRVTRLYEEDKAYTPNCFCGQLPAGRDGDRWIWDELRVPGSPDKTYPLGLTIADISPSDSAELTLWMIGFTDLPKTDDHLLNISLDGASLGSVIWDGKNGITHTVSIPAGLLTSTSQLKLALNESTNSIDGVWLDAFSITYTKKTATVSTAESNRFRGQAVARQYLLNLGESGWGFDVSDQNKPKLIGSGATFLIKDETSGEHEYVVTEESAVMQPNVRKATPFTSHNSANLLMIGPAKFEAGLAPLIQLRQSQGWSVGFISLAEIYDSYGYGYPSPFAVKAAIKDAYESAAVRPEAVILIGDGTYDPKLNILNGKETLMPVMFADVDPWIGEIPADNQYVTVDGDDVLPDILLGRLPVNNLDELKVVVNKLVKYPKQNFHWRENVMFVADDDDEAGAFSGFAQSQFSQLASDVFKLDSVQYLGSESSLANVQTRITEEFNQGNGHLIYVGHSTVHQWADENFIHISQVEGLTNQTRLPIVLEMTCFTGSFHMAGLDSLDEALLRHPTGGAIGVWGATGLSVTTGHDSLAEGYLEVLATGGNPVVGEATLAGKLKLMTDKPRHADLVDAYTFLGDPTLILADPAEGIQDMFLPVINR
ncbi:MAG: hypothetical protein ACI9EW_002907 [Cellvibrionaceae bacterium]|jgi:hypothetical protein